MCNEVHEGQLAGLSEACNSQGPQRVVVPAGSATLTNFASLAGWAMLHSV